MILDLENVIPAEFIGFFTGNIHENILEYERSKYGHEDALYEGLITTHPLFKSVSVLDKAGYYLINPNPTDNFFNVQVHPTDNLEDFLSKLNSVADNLGYFPAGVGSTTTKHIRYDIDAVESMLMKFGLAYVKYEAKYDLQIDANNYKYLYHATKKLYLPKIQKYGLTPKNSEKLSRHPERVYLTFDLADAKKFINKAVNRIPPKSYQTDKFPVKSMIDFQTAIILKIRVDQLQYNFRIYSDPNFAGSACYTLNTIPWSAITVVDEFELD